MKITPSTHKQINDFQKESFVHTFMEEFVQKLYQLIKVRTFRETHKI